MDCVASAGDDSFKLLTYQLPTVGYWLTVALTGNGGLGFDSGEGAWETATTSKEGSRRANYQILTQGGSDSPYASPQNQAELGLILKAKNHNFIFNKSSLMA